MRKYTVYIKTWPENFPQSSPSHQASRTLTQHLLSRAPLPPVNNDVSLSGSYFCSVLCNILYTLEPSPFISASLFLLWCYTNHKGTKTGLLSPVPLFKKIKLCLYFSLQLISSPEDSHVSSRGSWLWTDSLSSSFSEVKSISLTSICPPLPSRRKSPLQQALQSLMQVDSWWTHHISMPVMDTTPDEDLSLLPKFRNIHTHTQTGHFWEPEIKPPAIMSAHIVIQSKKKDNSGTKLTRT